jgi:hypothetical protein
MHINATQGVCMTLPMVAASSRFESSGSIGFLDWMAHMSERFTALRR